ncbi:hypothetical protein E3A20_08420, partial [Planctomyces bekefii]
IAEILCEIARELRRLPWALQVYRLRSHLQKAPPLLRSIRSAELTEHLFNLLLTLGTAGETSTRQMSRRLGANLDRLAIPEAQRLAFFDELEDIGLVYTEFRTSERTHQKWKLTQWAQDMTAEAFAHHLCKTCDDPFPLLSTLCPAYQAAVVALAPYREQRFLDATLALRPMSPVALGILLQRIAANSLPAVYDETLKRLGQMDLSPWLAKTLADAARAQGL